MRRLHVRTHTDIGAPAAAVFDFVADQTNAPQWQRGLHEVRRITPGPVGVGTEHVFVRRFARLNIESRNRFIAYEPDRFFVAFEIPAGKITGEASYLVEPTGPDSCRLVSEVDFRVSGLAGLATPLLTRVFERDSKRDEATLKQLLETRLGLASDRRVSSSVGQLQESTPEREANAEGLTAVRR
jgi:hypothetical protein